MGHLILWAVAAVLLAAILGRILTAPDLNWDALTYQLPFAGRLAGICGPDCYGMSDFYEHRFLGFPKAINYIQAGLWLASGWPQATGLVGVGVLLTLVAYLRLEFAVSPPLAFLAFLAVPLVMIHASSAYVDLSANALATIALLSVLVAWKAPERFATPCFGFDRGLGRLAVFAVTCALFANAKPQAFVPAGLLAGAMGLVLLVGWWKGRLLRDGRQRAALILFGACAVAVVWSPAGNLLRFGNPVYPIEFPLETWLGSWLFPGPEPLWLSWAASISPTLADIPSPQRWAMSVFEIHGYDGRSYSWTIDQGGVDAARTSFRMGGYGVGFVTANLLVFLALVLPGWLLGRTGEGPSSTVWTPTVWTRGAGPLFAGASLVTAAMPMAHELRYGMSWMLTLIALNLILLSRGVAGTGRSELALVQRGVVVMGLVSTLALTGGRYTEVHPEQDMEATLRVLGIDRQVAERVRDGDIVCLNNVFPLSYLYTSIFHPGRDYHVVDRVKPEGCDVTLAR